jgi:hypothetical protein
MRASLARLNLRYWGDQKCWNTCNLGLYAVGLGLNSYFDGGNCWVNLMKLEMISIHVGIIVFCLTCHQPDGCAELVIVP